MKRAVIYARYSSSSQNEQSIEGQLRVCEEYCKGKGLTVIGKYIDRAISGRTDVRPDFQRLIADGSKKMFEAVVVYKTDRFARNKYDSAIYKRQLRHAGIEIHYAAESIPDGPEGIILESLMEGLAEYYSAELSQKIKRGMNESALKCHCTGSGRALGYTVAADKSFLIDPDGARAVQTIFDMFIKGQPNAAICEYLNGLGARTSQGKPFNKSSVLRIIKNEKYIGVYTFGDIRVEGGIPAIVSREVFYIAQKELEKRKTSKQVRAPRAEYLLAGKLFCGDCKKSMVGVSGTGKSGKKHYYYYCPSARAKTGCQKKHVNRDWLESLVVEETLAHVLQPEVIQTIAAKVYALQQQDTTGHADEAYFEKQLVENKKALANVLRAIESGALTKTLPGRVQELEAEQANIEGELAALKSLQFELSQDQIEFMLRQYAVQGDDVQEYRRGIIESFVSSVYLYDDKLLIYYNISKGEELDASDLKLVESDGFDERSAVSTKKVMYEELNSYMTFCFVCDIIG